MNQASLFRSGWVKYGLLSALVAAGTATGLFLSGALTVPCPSCRDRETVTQPTPGPSAAPPSLTHRFPLTKLDAKNTHEAPELAADSAGRVFLTWASKTTETERTLFFTRTTDSGRTFEAPKALGKSGIFRSRSKRAGGGYERAATPHVAVSDKEVQLTWSEAPEGGQSLRLLLMTSTDAGVTFGTPRPVHQTQNTNPTFTAMAGGHGGGLACAWLGGEAQQVFAAVRRAGSDSFDEERLVHAGEDGKGVCPCCAVATCIAPDGTVFVAFRNIHEGYRDIFVSRLSPGHSTFAGPFPVVPNTWQYNGCPHDGPSLAVVGDALHVVWMDAHTGPSRCYHARALLADLKFDVKPLHADGPGTQGNAKLFQDGAGGLHAVWEESLAAEKEDAHAGHQHGPPKVGAGGGRAIQYAKLAPGQSAFGPARAVAPKPGAFQTRPAIVVTPAADLWVAWNELDESGKAVVVTRLPPLSSRGEGRP